MKKKLILVIALLALISLVITVNASCPPSGYNLSCTGGIYQNGALYVPPAGELTTVWAGDSISCTGDAGIHVHFYRLGTYPNNGNPDLLTVQYNGTWLSLPVTKVVPMYNVTGQPVNNESWFYAGVAEGDGFSPFCTSWYRRGERWGPIANFTAIPDNGYQPLSVNFTSTSQGQIDSWLWDFGDGYSSTTADTALHTYLLNGTFQASLMVTNDIGSSIAYHNITVGEPPIVPGSYNLTVHVNDTHGVKLSGVAIMIIPSDQVLREGTTDSTGTYQFAAVPGSATLWMDVRKTGYPEYVTSFTLTSDMTKDIILGGMGLKLYVDIKDSVYGTYLNNVNVGIQNTTSGVWRNTSGMSGYLYFDSTGANFEYPLAIGQTVVVAASKAGYRSDSRSVTIPNDHFTVALNLVNINQSTPSSGNFTAAVAVASASTGLEIKGASVTINELGIMGATNQAGTAMFYTVPVGSYTLLISATGYQSVTTDITGTSQETVLKQINLLPDGYRFDDKGNVIGPDGTIVPGGGSPGWGESSNTSAEASNEKAANGISIFLDSIVAIGGFVFLLIAYWFVKKVFFS